MPLGKISRSSRCTRAKRTLWRMLSWQSRGILGGAKRIERACWSLRCLQVGSDFIYARYNRAVIRTSIAPSNCEIELRRTCLTTCKLLYGNITNKKIKTRRRTREEEYRSGERARKRRYIYMYKDSVYIYIFFFLIASVRAREMRDSELNLAAANCLCSNYHRELKTEFREKWRFN